MSDPPVLPSKKIILFERCISLLVAVLGATLVLHHVAGDAATTDEQGRFHLGEHQVVDVGDGGPLEMGEVVAQRLLHAVAQRLARLARHWPCGEVCHSQIVAGCECEYVVLLLAADGHAAEARELMQRVKPYAQMSEVSEGLVALSSPSTGGHEQTLD